MDKEEEKKRSIRLRKERVFEGKGEVVVKIFRVVIIEKVKNIIECELNKR